MALQREEVDLSEYGFEIAKGPSFKDVLQATFFDRDHSLQFQFKGSKKHGILGTLVGQMLGKGQFCILIVEHHPERGKTERVFIFYDPYNRVGKLVEPKSLKDLLDFEKPRDERPAVKLDDFEREVEKLLSLVKYREFGLLAWSSFLEGQLTKVHEMSEQMLGIA